MTDITVLLADDHHLVRRGFRRMLEDDDALEALTESGCRQHPGEAPADDPSRSHGGRRYHAGSRVSQHRGARERIFPALSPH